MMILEPRSGPAARRRVFVLSQNETTCEDVAEKAQRLRSESDQRSHLTHTRARVPPPIRVLRPS